MKKTTIILLSVFFLVCDFTYAQNESINKEKIKTGWIFGAIPLVGFDSNTGIKYGGIANFYDYGDGTKYPRYNQAIYLELSRTSKGSGVNQLTYESKKLIPGVRTLIETSFLTEKALNFYGFNGYNAYYNSAFENPENDLYRSRVFYCMDRKMIKIKTEFIGKLQGDNLKWFGGFEYYNIRLDTVDLGNLNKGKEMEDLLPSVGGGLYGNFIRWGLIPQDQANGGSLGVFKIGAIYDTRDNEPNPMTGIWTELQFLLVPDFLSNGYGYTRIAFTHRQYFTIVPKRINFAFRVSYQAKLSGEMPFYILPFVYNTPPQLTQGGLGGAKNVRGILRNRVVGEDFMYANAEVRWKVIRTVVLNQNFYIALSCFTDAGMVTRKYEFKKIIDPILKGEADQWLGQGEPERLHLSYGAGIHFVFNDNFIVSGDYGLVADKRDGKKGTYVNMKFLF
jgi:hypothetical protein